MHDSEDLFYTWQIGKSGGRVNAPHTGKKQQALITGTRC